MSDRGQLFFLRSRTKRVRGKRYPSCSSDTPLQTHPIYCHLLPYLLPSTASPFSFRVIRYLPYRNWNWDPQPTRRHLYHKTTHRFETYWNCLIYIVFYNSTTQINVYWYVRGKHFDFWQATTEQGKPGYFTTVRYAVSLRAKGNAKGNGVPY